ncbi:MAG TPA: sulfite exporter TauE/SafE family protein [Janthinobacterium sp.]|jgi:uncharacterized membrane protein YfcA|nr:sulfite exporter TauE/SafE family protein [Janthinobacterium sp.]
MFLGILLGAGVGALLGLTGAGGGVLAVPALMLGLGMDMGHAAPVALTAVGTAAIVGSTDGLRRGLVRYKAALLMAGLGALFAPAGVWLAHRLPSVLLITLFCGVMLLIAARMLMQVWAGERGQLALECNCMLNPSTGKLRWNARCALTLAGIGSMAGLLTGMLGIGGGFLIVPALRRFSNLTMQYTTATSLAVIALVSSATVAGTLAAGAHFGLAGWLFVAASAAGMVCGRALATRLPGRWLQIGFAFSVLSVALLWLWKTLL